MPLDLIVEKSRLDTGGIDAALLDLELQGIVRQLPGNQFSMNEESL